MPNRIAVDTAVCIRGSRRSECASRSEAVGVYRQMAKHYGGVSDDSADKGRAAFTALLSGGTSGFNAVLGGNCSDGQYARLEAHGFYWTASDNDPGSAPFYNFGQNGQALHRQPQGEKQMAISVRCVRG